MAEIKQIILLGSARLLYACAREIKRFYPTGIEVKVIDSAYTPMNRKYVPEFGDTGSMKGKEAVFSYLKGVQQPSWLLSVNNTYILPRELCENPQLSMINLHHALLPLHPGRNAEAWTIYDMDILGGITWHYISPGIDTGDIICQRSVRLTEDMTSLNLLKVCEELALQSLREELLPLENLDRSKAYRQDHSCLQPKKAVDIPNDGCLDLTWDLQKSFAFLRAMDYGALHTLGRPKLLLNGTIYTVSTYRVEAGTFPGGRAEVRPLDGGQCEYVLHEAGRSLKLRLTPTP